MTQESPTETGERMHRGACWLTEEFAPVPSHLWVGQSCRRLPVAISYGPQPPRNRGVITGWHLDPQVLAEATGNWDFSDFQQGLTFLFLEHLRHDRVRTDILGDVISAQTAGLLGAHSTKRLREFLQTPAGWNFGEGKELSVRAVREMEKFLDLVGYEFRSALGHPSVFQGTEGNLALIWNKREGYYAEVRFFSDRVDYFFETPKGEVSSDESTINEAAGALVKALPEHA